MSNNNSLRSAYELGQSLWLDFIERSILEGELQSLIANDSIMGLTSNPSIFEQAISKSEDYDSQIAEILANQADISNLELFNALAISDIQSAADAFRDTYEATDGLDGMVSLEVSPTLAFDADATVASAVDLHERVSRPNLLIKVPATKAGVEAFETLTAMGISVNVTLLFSVTRYREIAQAYIRGLEHRLQHGHSVERIASVASFFVSRVDTAVDKALEDNGSSEANALLGKIAVANAKVAYGHFVNLFGSEGFQKLAAAKARPQRLLWASTGTKNPNYSDVLYVEELIGPDTVNTLPPATMDAFRDHGVAENRLTKGLANAHANINALSDLGISLSEITDKLEADGVSSFQDAFSRLLDTLAEKRKLTAS